MLALDPKDIFNKNSIILRTLRNGKPSFSKSFSVSDDAELLLYTERGLGVTKPRISIHADASECVFNADFLFLRTEGMYDIYSFTFETEKICTRPSLVFYMITFNADGKEIYFASKNNVDGFLTYDRDHAASCEFKMTVFEDGYETPQWFHDGLMYHIFVDRFCRGSKKVPVRSDAIINDEWYDGIPQYGNHPGDFCANNMFFGGTLYGICEKLDYLSSLGVSVIYLSPIFEAYSNHKYDTGDYSRVDEMFGGEDALCELIEQCNKRGMKIILDGVFNHTGDDSIYFNKYGRYGETGAFKDPSSPYKDWYYFSEYPNEYASWWGITILPKLNTGNPDVENFLAGECGIVSKYLDMGIAGYRLDVADELPDSFLCKLRQTVKNKDRNALIIGEVWENAADKCAYGARRSYFLGKQLDGVMNYPIKDAIVDFVINENTQKLRDTVCDIYSSYPFKSSLSLMNILGTHDTERIITVLGTNRHAGMCGDELAFFSMTDEEYFLGKKRLLCASVLQYTLPGVPSVFYGDEAGTQGGHDPFCRKTFPWGKEDKDLVKHYKKLGSIRRNNAALCRGEFDIVFSENGVFSFERKYENEKITVAVNMGQENYTFASPSPFSELYSGKVYGQGGEFVIPRESFAVIKHGI